VFPVPFLMARRGIKGHNEVNDPFYEFIKRVEKRLMIWIMRLTEKGDRSQSHLGYFSRAYKSILFLILRLSN